MGSLPVVSTDDRSREGGILCWRITSPDMCSPCSGRAMAWRWPSTIPLPLLRDQHPLSCPPAKPPLSCPPAGSSAHGLSPLGKGTGLPSPSVQPHQLLALAGTNTAGVLASPGPSTAGPDNSDSNLCRRASRLSALLSPGKLQPAESCCTRPSTSTVPHGCQTST